MVRALVITPIVFVGALAVTILSPLIHLLLFLIDLVDRRAWRFTRVGGLGVAFCVVETFGLAMAFLLWIASGFGLWTTAAPIQDLNAKVLSTWLEMITRAIRAFIGFEFVFPDEELLPGPVLVFSRHAGPGDALLLARALIRDHGRRIRMLGTTKLLWDPFFNHLVNRLPFYFCEPSALEPDKQLSEVRNAVATIESDGAMIIFPEGGNFTPRRQREALARLEELGQLDRLERARGLRYVLPPRTGGTIAALEAAEAAHIIFVAHVGLDDLLSLKDLWHRIPINRTVQATYWYARHLDDPTDRPSAINWLYDHWEEVDRWIDLQAPKVTSRQDSA